MFVMQWQDHAKDMLYKLLRVVSTILLILLIMRDPMITDQEHPDLKQSEIVPKYTSITRQIPAINYKVKNVDENLIDLKAEAKDKNIYEFIESKLLAAESVADAKSIHISPLHRTMLLLGCYGDRWNDTMTALLQKDFMKKERTAENPLMFVNFMLQALDLKADYSKSTCSCLRDFANPSVLKVAAASNTLCDTKNGHNKYYHDTCSVGNLTDYAIDSTGFVEDGTNKKRLILADSNTPSTRSKKDPMIDEVDTYITTLIALNINYADTLKLDHSNPHIVALKNFLTSYCKYATDDKDNDNPLECPTAWFKANPSEGLAVTTLSVKIVTERMKTWAHYMHTYNKLRTPTTMSDSDFETYLEKYREAFRMCSAVGVQKYQIEITGTTQPVHWYVIGQFFLLFASSLSFLWVRFLQDRIKDRAMQPAGYGLFDSFYVFITTLMPFAYIVIIMYYGITFGMADLEMNDEISGNSVGQFGNYLDGFVAVWIILGLILCVFFVYIFYKAVNQTDLLMPVKMLAHLCMCCTRKATRYEVLAQGTGPAQAQTSFLNAPAETKVHHTMFIAQIAIDVPIIIGLTFMAIGTTLQRGVSDYNLILTIIVLCTSTGLTTHITNVLRLLHLKQQDSEINSAFYKSLTPTPGAEQAQTSDLTSEHKKITYNRVFIALLISLLLYVLLNLAGLDVVKGSEFAVLHQFWVVVFAFAILILSDVSLEFFAFFYRQFERQQQYLITAISDKCKSTGYIILIGLYMLQLHQRYWLCPAYELAHVDGPNRPILCSYW
jgi:hypothetical protein